ncbi:MAG: DnaD domain protein [Agathobacter sp.]|nr:DnaD domain protein [Agathobacter sp.]
MSRLQLKSDYPHNHISVPRVFIDKYMADANGEFVKVYLFLLRCMGTSATSECSISAIADHFNYTEKDILRALKYWEKVGVLSMELNNTNELTALCFKDLTGGIQQQAESVTNEPDVKIPNVSSKDTKTTADNNATKKSSTKKKREYTLDEIKAFSSNDEVTELLFIIETYLKHPLNSTEMNTVFYWYDGLKFSGELIEYLVEYCITNGHSSLRYMDKVAIGWTESGIDTIEKAKEHISIRSKAYYSIMKAFGISGRNLADSELAFVNKWTKEYSFDIELIQEACRRTISATQKPSFEYADSILTNWYHNNVHTLKDVAVLDEVFNKNKQTTSATQSSTTVKRNKFNNFHQRKYDTDEYEKMLLTTSVQ